MDKETIKWMTGREKYKATFREFAVACHLDYDFMKEGVQMNELPSIEENQSKRSKRDGRLLQHNTRQSIQRKKANVGWT